MNQIEFLLRLSENAQDEGEELAKRHNQERDAFVKQLLDLERMIDLARQNVHAELGRWGLAQAQAGHAVPQQGKLPPSNPKPQGNAGTGNAKEPPMPGFLQKGPAISS